ncbi:ead/Ea22-like family protein [Escherichia coli]|uniref:ead/Ea22-like family protein n=1 Tax=Escherichia coli TaxID=562 RepID=UPI000BB89C98|nr:ead/Ea22-like family protein [Escherichia coli]MDK2023883.1 ead/Ea22-like family protein [Escherichia coli]HAI2553458.1 ead/Ea22-like family protein [Escherichia coli]
MSEINYQALREAAEKALHGEWGHEAGAIWNTCDSGYVQHMAAVEAGDDVSDEEHMSNMRFITLATPTVVLGLLDELSEAKAAEENESSCANSVIDIAINWQMRAKDAEAKLEAAEKRNAKLQSENAYIRNRYKELDLLIGKNILVMQAAIIEWQATGDAKSGLAWIYNTLFGPGELPDESEKDAQAYFNRKYAPIDEKLMALHKWFWEQSEAERAAGIRIKGE